MKSDKKHNKKEQKTGFSNVPRIIKKGKTNKSKVKNNIPAVNNPIINTKTVEIPEVKKTPYVKSSIEDKYKELPWGYNETKIVLLLRDPFWLYAYWEVNGDSIESMKRKLGNEFFAARSVLRVYDVTEMNASKYFDIVLSGLANSWYINVGETCRSWCVEIGMITSSGRYKVFARSNTTRTPSDKVSDVFDEEWMISEEELSRMYMQEGLKKGKGSEFVSRTIFKRLQQQLSSGAVSSLSSISGATAAKPALFWMKIGTELIVYGATEPDAAVKINNNQIKIMKDGTFSFRVNIADDRYAINVEGISKDGKLRKYYTINLSKNTVEGN